MEGGSGAIGCKGAHSVGGIQWAECKDSYRIEVGSEADFYEATHVSPPANCISCNKLWALR